MEPRMVPVKEVLVLSPPAVSVLLAPVELRVIHAEFELPVVAIEPTVSSKPPRSKYEPADVLSMTTADASAIRLAAPSRIVPAEMVVVPV